MPALDEHRHTIQIIAMLIVVVIAGISALDSRLSFEWRAAHGVLMTIAALTLVRAFLKSKKGR